VFEKYLGQKHWTGTNLLPPSQSLSRASHSIRILSDHLRCHEWHAGNGVQGSDCKNFSFFVRHCFSYTLFFFHARAIAHKEVTVRHYLRCLRCHEWDGRELKTRELMSQIDCHEWHAGNSAQGSDCKTRFKVSQMRWSGADGMRIDCRTQRAIVRKKVTVRHNKKCHERDVRELKVWELIVTHKGQ